MIEPTILSLLPSAITIVVAIATRKVILSLGVGVMVGMTIAEGFNPMAGAVNALERGLFLQLSKGANAQILVLIFVIGGFVRQLDCSGGMRPFAARITRRVNTPARAQIAVLLTGIAIFFTDSGNSLILGPIYRPVFDKLRICREKLAFILDATSSPVCVLVPFIGWGVYIMSLIDQGYANAGQEVHALMALLAALPFQFYPLLAISSILLFALVGRDFGPMDRAQARLEAELQRTATVEAAQPEEAEVGAALVLVPLGTVFLTIAGLFAFYSITTGSLPGTKIRTSLVLAYLAGAAVSAAMLRHKASGGLAASAAAFGEGARRMLSIAVVLLLAWSLGEVCVLLGTSSYVATLLRGALPGGILPPLIFLIGAVISLSTGSSYGTLAILMPIAIPLALNLGAPMAVTVAAVLSGGILGDHASPISDTTILSSMATGCRHSDHVNTQLPYALLTGSAALAAFVLAGLTASHLSVLLGLVMLTLLIFGATHARASRRRVG